MIEITWPLLFVTNNNNLGQSNLLIPIEVLLANWLWCSLHMTIGGQVELIFKELSSWFVTILLWLQESESGVFACLGYFLYFDNFYQYL